MSGGESTRFRVHQLKACLVDLGSNTSATGRNLWSGFPTQVAVILGRYLPAKRTARHPFPTLPKKAGQSGAKFCGDFCPL